MRVKRAYHTDLEDAEGTTQRTSLIPGKPRSSYRRKRDEALQATAATTLAGITLKPTSVSVQRGSCAVIKVQCCVYIPDVSGYRSATLDDMKGQVKVMSGDNLPF